MSSPPERRGGTSHHMGMGNRPTAGEGSECDRPRGRLVIAVLARERDREASSPFDLYNYEAEHFHAPFLHNATKSRYLDRLA